MVLDREMEDERDEDPGVDLSTDEYDGGEELADKLVERLADEAIDEGIARFECPTERNRLVKVLGVARATTLPPWLKAVRGYTASCRNV